MITSGTDKLFDVNTVASVFTVDYVLFAGLATYAN
jgi:hypothetical protein